MPKASHRRESPAHVCPGPHPLRSRPPGKERTMNDAIDDRRMRVGTAIGNRAGRRGVTLGERYPAFTTASARPTTPIAGIPQRRLAPGAAVPLLGFAVVLICGIAPTVRGAVAAPHRPADRRAPARITVAAADTRRGLVVAPGTPRQAGPAKAAQAVEKPSSESPSDTLDAAALREAAQRMLADVKYLASDELEGRGLGTRGLDEAAEFIKRRFAEAGLDVTAVDGDAFQRFTVTIGSSLAKPPQMAVYSPAGDRIALKPGKEFNACSFGSSGHVEAELVFCGYGIRAEKPAFDEFAGVDVKGKAVIIMRRTPRQGDPHSPFAGPHGQVSRHAALLTKVSHAYGAGAAAVLFVNDPFTVRKNKEALQNQLKKLAARIADLAEQIAAADADNAAELQQRQKRLQDTVAALIKAKQRQANFDADPLMPFGYGGHEAGGRTMPVVHIKQSVCNRILKAATGRTLDEIAEQIDRTLKPASRKLKGWTVDLDVDLKRERVEARNVIGVLRGTGPHADEVIVVGAHYDHLGRGGVGSLAPRSKDIHNGADDNASGTAALIELARQLGREKHRLPRTIVFIAFTAEERGLLGSSYYVRHPVFPLEKTIAMFNMDMVGRLRDDKLIVMGSGTAKQWEPLLKRLAPRYGLNLKLTPDGFGPSDHASFYARKIPVLHLFTGNHADYHRPSDDWQKINAEGMARIVGLLKDIVLEVAAAPQRPEYVAVARPSRPARTGDRPYFGSIPDFGGDQPGYAISGVAPGSPAEKAGLKGGDVIVKLNDIKIGNLEDFDLALRRFSAGDTVKVEVLRDGKRLTFEVTLGAPR
ncbi:MAG: M20/M25/M40 family metallo-hydrolase [Planctomycetota bacterium]|nr:MAG: M20/M25/M40 family metallo-hydrolase [Planctomycetota bacterium]